MSEDWEHDHSGLLFQDCFDPHNIEPNSLVLGYKYGIWKWYVFGNNDLIFLLKHETTWLGRLVTRIIFHSKWERLEKR